jgi:DNA polymerase-3 subunit beta
MFTVNRSLLKTALADVSRAVNRATLPILECILFSVEDQRLRLCATDLELTIQRWIPLAAMASQNETIAVPGGLINDLVAFAPDGDMTFTVDPVTLEVSIESGVSKNKLKCQDAAEFPPLNPMPDHALVEIPAEHWRDIARKVAYAAAPDSLRPALTGVLLELSESTFHAVATDGFRIAVCEFPLLQNNPQSQTALVPAKALAKVGTILNEGNVRLVIDSGQLMAYTEDTIVACQLLDAKFPDWRQIMPESFSTSLQLDYAELDRSIRQALVVAREGTAALSLAAENNSVIILGDDQAGSQSHSVLASQKAGQTTVTFNGIFALQTLKALAGVKTIAVEINAHNTPMAISSPEAQAYCVVMMPIQVNGDRNDEIAALARQACAAMQLESELAVPAF